MRSIFINWLKWKIAGKELEELARIRHRVIEVEVWCSHIKPVSIAASYILKGKEAYPYQSLGYHGSIEDFRRYIEKVAKEYKIIP